MKKLLLSAAFVCVATISANAQQLLSDNFDSYTVGNVGTDLTGATPGQGDWYTLVPAGGSNSNFQFVAETGRGNVFTIESTNQPPAATGQPGNYRLASKIGFDNAMWNTKATGNNILKVEYEFYTGAATTSKATHRMSVSSANRTIGGFTYVPETRMLHGLAYANPQGGSGAGLYNINLATGGLVLDANTWYKVTFFVDFSTSKATWQIPAKNINGTFDLVSVASEAPADISFVAIAGANNAAASTIKYDNYLVSAVNTTTATVNDIVSTKFNVYPNPATDVITITNTESIGIDKITVTDINGRIVKTNNYSQQAEIQLNVSDLNAGVYILNVSTKEGTATKKIIKK
ncbi:T9SS type A sorting domain-containing protein [Flavobacterium sp. xlx-214]|uniref:T9SS type A sorting domain-containing protein n=1 Tax=unclassified Flavobacterium TaxID=196869 RepID=UPI0013D3E3EA|nr:MULTISPECIES: T9SS type A sorting domain-containing protein [unclassified Flavobacterium]MBA5792322.1 T9SS type A sorting domain-containing protein [Flavobacterium sp. xlx-221]QMI82362.1 T9SS type A sorting domain-containing protein [Flavobacterium sp. xlx-214]